MRATAAPRSVLKGARLRLVGHMLRLIGHTLCTEGHGPVHQLAGSTHGGRPTAHISPSRLQAPSFLPASMTLIRHASKFLGKALRPHSFLYAPTLIQKQSCGGR